jgi:hypothetical protein
LPSPMEDEDLIDFDKAGLHSLWLPAFWVDKPVSWFVLAESRSGFTALTESRPGTTIWSQL